MDLARTPEYRVADGASSGRRQEAIPVHLFEDAEGRLVVADGRRARAARSDAGPLLRIGRTRLALHHLAPAVAQQLAVDGAVVVEGPDALNVLLALAEAASRDRDGGVPG